MIRRHEPGAIWLIHQGAHAFLAAQIAAHWTGLGADALREELILTAAVHDAGWTSAEQPPTLNPDGLPRSFMEMPMRQHMQIWRSSIESAFAQNPYAGLLTSLHCTALYAARQANETDAPEDAAAIAEFVAERRGWEEALAIDLRDHPRYSAGAAEGMLAESLRRLQVWDYLSLLACLGPEQDTHLDDVPLADGCRRPLHVTPGEGRQVVVDPFPLDMPLEVWIAARRLPDATFAADDALAEALVEVPYEALHLTIRGA